MPHRGGTRCLFALVHSRNRELNAVQIKAFIGMEFSVHKWRFPDWMPSPIRSIVGDPTSSMVAVGREDGDIEVLLAV